ncbi:Lrp/AsnC family transcriptional regulator [Nanoarchaeota archaeon]
MFKLDTLDANILKELDLNSRQSEGKIAEKLHVNKQLVNSRIKRLVKRGIISKFTTSIDLPSIGYPIGLNVYLKVNKLPNEFVEKLKAIREVVTITRLSGDFDLLLQVFVKTVNQADDILIKIRKDGKENINQILYYMMTQHFLKAIDENEEVYFNLKDQNLDKKDRIILKELIRNSRIQTKELAKKVGLSRETVAIRIRKLQLKKVIKRFNIHRDYHRIYRNVFVILVRDIGLDDKQKEQLIGIVKEFQTIAVGFYINGLRISTSFDNIAHFHRLVDKIASQFPQMREINTNTVVGYIKRDWSSLIK